MPDYVWAIMEPGVLPSSPFAEKFPVSRSRIAAARGNDTTDEESEWMRWCGA